MSNDLFKGRYNGVNNLNDYIKLFDVNNSLGRYCELLNKCRCINPPSGQIEMEVSNLIEMMKNELQEMGSSPLVCDIYGCAVDFIKRYRITSKIYQFSDIYVPINIATSIYYNWKIFTYDAYYLIQKLAEYVEKGIKPDVRGAGNVFLRNYYVESNKVEKIMDSFEKIDVSFHKLERQPEKTKDIVIRNTSARIENFENEHKLMQKAFDAVRQELVSVNEAMRKLEDSFAETNTKKVSGQMLELYNLIADTRDAAFKAAEQAENKEIEDVVRNSAYNMEEFMNMIEYYLSDYGIKPLISNKGDAFSGKYHTITNSQELFDPYSARVNRSVRTGFIWGEQVIQKEKIEI